MMHELPPQGRGTAEQQLAELRDYLVRMARDLDRVSSSEVVVQQAAGKAAAKAQKQSIEDVRARAEALKALIVKTADEVTAYADSKVEEYNSLYVAQSEFGSYYNVIERQVEATARGTVDSYRYADAIESAQTAADSALQAAEEYRMELFGQIRRGIMEDPRTHELHLGIAIAENLEFTGNTTTYEGNTYYELKPEQTLGLYTAAGWQFWVNGQLCGYFVSGSNQLHVAGINASDRIDLGSGANAWEITAANGFGLRCIGG